MSEELGENVIHCKLMGMGHDHLCKNFSENKCLLCQLRNMYNDKYGLIVNDVEISYSKEDNIEGLFIVLKPKSGLSATHKEHVNNKLAELLAIKELIYKYDKCS